MTRRRVTATRCCPYEGCKEFGYFEYSSLRERAESDEWYAKHPYRCVRHAKPDEVLSVTNTERTTTLVADKSETFPELKGLFWDTGSGLTFGPGFKAYANDFPPGTKLIITARIELP